MGDVPRLRPRCDDCLHYVSTIRLETGSEDPGELLAQCDGPMSEAIMGVNGLVGGAAVWVYADATCDSWTPKRETWEADDGK